MDVLAQEQLVQTVPGRGRFCGNEPFPAVLIPLAAGLCVLPPSPQAALAVAYRFCAR